MLLLLLLNAVLLALLYFLSGRFTHRLNDATYGWCGDYNSAGRYNGTWINTLREGGYSVGYFGIL